MLANPLVSIVLAAVHQPGLAQLFVAIDHLMHALAAAPQHLGDLRLGHGLVGMQHDQITDSSLRVDDATQRALELGTDIVMQYDPSCSLGHPFLSVATVGTDARFTMCNCFARSYLETSCASS
jgi:hypothetical protein